ncbi:MAG: SCO family protein [Planctomycetia bacterium]|nr:SCO family protein [Planctomycetia bacterium]
MKHLAVKLWLSLMLVALMGYTGYSLWRVSQRNKETQVPAGEGSAPVVTVGPTKPLDLASYTMTERSGDSMSLEQLRGQVWIGSMFYASCPSECLQLNRTIAALHKDPLFRDVKFVSITVDPATDTPETLRDYGKALGADPKHWLFLNGSLSDVARLGRDMNISAGYKTHVRRLLLFDREGKVRGMFTFDDGQDIAKLREMVPELLKERTPTAKKTGTVKASP